MPRIRSIKPHHSADSRVGRLSDRAYRVWVNLLTLADDAGRLELDPVQIRAYIFAYQKVTTQQVLDSIEELVGAGLLLRYVVEDEGYLWFPRWRKHQRIDRASPSELPPHPDDTGEPARVGRPRVFTVPGFGRFWEVYPRRVARADAERAWAKNVKSEDVDAIVAAVLAQRESFAWKKDNGQFIPYPATWLNARRWTDQVAIAPTRPALALFIECDVCGKSHLQGQCKGGTAVRENV